MRPIIDCLMMLIDNYPATIRTVLDARVIICDREREFHRTRASFSQHGVRSEEVRITVSSHELRLR